ESARQWFKPGVPKGVGVISRSGGMASSTGYYLGQAGVRISTIVHIGGDAVIGIRLPDAALMFEQDPLTEAIVIFGEIGSSQEEELAQLIVDRKVTKPVIAYIGGAVYLILTGELPSTAVAHLMDAILVSSIDHGATPPSALAARSVASTGATLSASVAAGIMSINRHHGGAIEDCARQLKAIADRATTEAISMDEAATRALAAMRDAGERMPGFGHRYHTKDPRTARLFELAREAGVDGAYMK